MSKSKKSRTPAQGPAGGGGLQLPPVPFLVPALTDRLIFDVLSLARPGSLLPPVPVLSVVQAADLPASLAAATDYHGRLPWYHLLLPIGGGKHEPSWDGEQDAWDSVLPILLSVVGLSPSAARRLTIRRGGAGGDPATLYLSTGPWLPKETPCPPGSPA